MSLSLEEITYAYDLPPEKAIEFFKSKGVIITESYLEAMKATMKHAFTITNVNSLEVLNDFKEMLKKALEDGITLDEFKKQIKLKLAERGWLGRVIKETGPKEIDSPWRLNLIFRQNIQNAYQSGRWWQQQNVIKDFPYGEFIATVDPSTTSGCLGLDGTILKMNNSFWKINYPPRHFMCRSRVRTLDADMAKEKGVSDPADYKKVEPAPGFDNNPGDEWKPDLSKYPDELVKEYEKVAE